MIQRLGRFDWKVAAPLLVTVILALSGYYYTYQKDLSFAKRKDQLARVDRQLGELYGPLYALSNAGTRTMREFRSKYRPYVHGYWGTNPPPTREEAEAWRLWIKEVFMPLNLEMAALIIKHSDLLVESEMPTVLLDLAAHIAGYKPILKSWERGDFSQNTSLIDFPQDLITYAETNYRLLKKRQTTLLGELEQRW